MTSEEYQAANVMVALVANTIESLPLGVMSEMQSRAAGLGPILDPTLFRQKAKDFKIDMERTRILAKAQADLKRLRERVQV